MADWQEEVFNFHSGAYFYGVSCTGLVVSECRVAENEWSMCAFIAGGFGAGRG